MNKTSNFLRLHAMFRLRTLFGHRATWMEGDLMQRNLRPLVLALVFVLPLFSAHAYEVDIHYSATFAIARAVGWSDEDALLIASANQGVDENKETVAALEIDAIALLGTRGFYPTSLVHQAEKNFKFHCFSKVQDQANGDIAENVLKTFNELSSSAPSKTQNKFWRTYFLTAVGVALHCLQDAFSHNGYGGKCGAYDGSCTGHTIDSFKDAIAYTVNKTKHMKNPDHPAVLSGRVLWALRATAYWLTKYYTFYKDRHIPDGNVPPVPDNDLIDLANALEGSGKISSDDDRRSCNRYLVAKWLYGMIARKGNTQTKDTEPVPANLSCNGLDGAFRVKIPDAKYPRMDKNASPRGVTEAGGYDQVGGPNSFDVWIPMIEHNQTANAASLGTYTFKVQVDRAQQLVGLAMLMQVIVVPFVGDPFGVKIEIPSGSGTVDLDINFEGPAFTDYFVQAQVVPDPKNTILWNDKDIANDELSCGIDSKVNPGITDHLGELNTGWRGTCSARPVKKTPMSTLNAPENLRIVPRASAPAIWRD